VKSGIEEGATLVVGGKRPEGFDKGFYYEPTPFINCDNRMRICQEEIFGPVLSVITYRDEQEAIRIANDSVYGLAGACFSGAPPEVRYFAQTQAAMRRPRTGSPGTRTSEEPVFGNTNPEMHVRAPGPQRHSILFFAVPGMCFIDFSSWYT
jgi:hypothetical protein